MPPPPMDYESPAHIVRAEAADVDVAKMVKALNGGTEDETSGATEFDMDGVKFKLKQSAIENHVIAEITQTDGSVKTVVLEKTPLEKTGAGGPDYSWRPTTMDPDMVRNGGPVASR